ncbi:MAG TPA: high-potential iron-sulfur protein [Salinibacter sp.]|nr:high-potential iron-sulfur protein [Salinibacter sp.]
MSADEQDRVTRRRFLQSIGVAGVVGASGSLLAACGGGDDSGGGDSGGSAESSSKTASADCTDISMLSDAQKKQRSQMVKSLQYVEETPEADKNCANCQLYQKGAYEGCGGCQLFPGPVTENGYCNSWAPAS